MNNNGMGLSYFGSKTSECLTCLFTFATVSTVAGILLLCRRDYIKRCVNANGDDVLLFTGSGVTGAVHKLVSCLEIKPSETVK